MFNIRSLRWWPLVPGFLLPVIGAIVTSGHMGKDVLSAAADWWPILLVLMGAFLLYRARSHGMCPTRRLRAGGRPRRRRTAGPGARARRARSRGARGTRLARRRRAGRRRGLAPPVRRWRGRRDVRAYPTAIPSVYPLRPSTHSLADATGGQVGGDRPGSVESGSEAPRIGVDARESWRQSIGLGSPRRLHLRDDVAADELELGRVPDIADAEDRVHRARLGPAAEPLDERGGRQRAVRAVRRDARPVRLVFSISS